MGQPYWVSGKQHQDYPSNRYLVGVGQGISLAVAEDNAQKDLFQRLELGFVKNLQTNISKQKFSWLDPLAHFPDLGHILPKPKTTASWTSQDGTKHAAFVVIDRNQDMGPVEEQIKNLESEVKRLEMVGEQALQPEQDPARALALYLKALDVQVEADLLRDFYQWTLEGEWPQSHKSKTYEISETIDRLITSIDLKPIQGNGQQLQPDQTVANPLIVAVQFHLDTVPIGARSMPVRLAWGMGVQIKEVDHRTNEFGLAVIRIDPSSAPQEGINQVWIRIDGDKVLSEAGITNTDKRYDSLIARLNSLRANFNFLIPGTKTIRVALVVTEHIANEAGSSGTVKKAIEQAMNREGWQVVDIPNDVAFDLEGETDLEKATEKLIKIFESKADVLICGIITSDLVRIVNDRLVFSSASGLMIVGDVASGKILNRLNEITKAAGQEATGANLRALDNFARKVVPIFVETVRKWKGDTQ